MIAQIHAGERIVPAADNAALTNAVQGGGGGGGDTHNFNIFAQDASTFRQFLNNPVNRRNMAQIMSDELNRQASLRPTY